MQTKDLVFYNCTERQVVKELCENFPNISITILTQTLVIESIDLCNLSAFVVASQNCKSVSKANLECNQQCHCFDRVVAAIDVVTHKQIVCVWRLTSDAEQFFQIVKLPMNVSANGNWSSHHRHIRLVH